jgi:hypothetical protein
MKTKRDFLKEKYESFQSYLMSQSNVQSNELENDEDVIEFRKMNEEQLIMFAINKLSPYKNNLSYPAKRIMEIFKIDENNQKRLMIENYLELILSLIE